MKYNLGKKDRMIRLFIAAILFALFANTTVTGLLAYFLLGAAVILVLTSLLSFCPLYALFGWRSTGQASKLP